MTTTTRIVLYQLACTADDSTSNSAPYVTEADAKQGEIDLARIWMAGRLDAHELRQMIEEGDIETEREAHAVSDLDDLEDEAVLDLARDRINFDSSIDPVFLDVPLAFLTDAIRAAGAAATVFTVEDVADRFDGDRDDAADWLRDNTGRIEDTLSERGNEAIDDLLTADGKMTDAGDEGDREAFYSNRGRYWYVDEWQGGERYTIAKHLTELEALDIVHGRVEPSDGTTGETY